MPDSNSHDLAYATSGAAFATNRHGQIVFWNKAAERLLGLSPKHVLGRPCHEVIRGQDLFGNRFCHESCSMMNMAEQREPLNGFEMEIRHASGRRIRSRFDLVVLRRNDNSEFAVLHLMNDVHAERRAVAEIEKVAQEIACRSTEQKPGRAVVPLANGPLANELRLTPRESQILALLAEGTRTPAVADALEISQTTVRNHVQSLLKKLGVHSKLEAVALAYKNGLV